MDFSGATLVLPSWVWNPLKLCEEEHFSAGKVNPNFSILGSEPSSIALAFPTFSIYLHFNSKAWKLSKTLWRWIWSLSTTALLTRISVLSIHLQSKGFKVCGKLYIHLLTREKQMFLQSVLWESVCSICVTLSCRSFENWSERKDFLKCICFINEEHRKVKILCGFTS